MSSTQPKKFFLLSKGIVFGCLTLALALIILAVEVDGLPHLDFWPDSLPDGQWFKVVGAGLAVISSLGSIWGRIVADRPISFFR